MLVKRIAIFMIIMHTHDKLLFGFVYSVNSAGDCHLRFFYWFYVDVLYIGKNYLKMNIVWVNIFEIAM